VNTIFTKVNSHQDLIQNRLIRLVIVFNFIGCLLLTLAPVVRLHSWSADLRWHQWIGFLVWIIGIISLNMIISKRLPDRDPYIFPLISILTAWGLLTIYRLDVDFGLRQTIWLLLSFIIGYLVLRIQGILTFLRRYKYIWLTGGLLLTLLTFVIGVYPGGTGPALWLNLFGLYLQPSELLKVLLVIFLASYLADSLRIRFNLLQLLLPTLILVGAAFLILVAQHDLGTASLFIAIYAVTIYLASGKRRLLLISMVTIIVALFAGYAVYDVIQLRIEAWLNPWADPNGRSYQIVQSIIAVANGGIFGRGIGLGSPGVIPVAHSDFIFPAIAEETGLLGSAGIILLYSFFMIRGLTIALNAPNQFQRFLAAGLTTAITVQSILIIGGSIRLLPLTGVTLPFMSYGGSSLVTFIASAFLLLVISSDSEHQSAPLERSQPYRLVGGIFLAGYASLILLSTWWAVFQSNDLLSRNDNPRRFISDFYISRGSIYDQNEQLLVSTTGNPGVYSQTLTYPLLSGVIGYTDATYGQAGLQASQDGYLRGVYENDYWSIFQSRLLFGQYPRGFDLRTSISLDIQTEIDKQLLNHKGSILLMNAESGEILAIATSPTFNANNLAESMSTWKSDPESPLLNRSTQGLYPPGSIIGGLILNNLASDNNALPEIPAFFSSMNLDEPYYCSRRVEIATSWVQLISAGCPSALNRLVSTLKPVDLYNLYSQFGLLTQPEVQIESAANVNLETFNDIDALLTGRSTLLVTPLQVALAYAPFSNGGKVIQPVLVTAYRKPGFPWQLLSNSSEVHFLEEKISPILEHPSGTEITGWSISSTVPIQTGTLDWYIQGTPQNWRGLPLVLVVALEDSNPSEAAAIGAQVFGSVTHE
jgi:cell division protein FtsW (lipid II flippase)